MLKRGALIETTCPVSGEPLRLQVGAGGPEPGAAGFVHFAVRAARWWEDIGYT